MVRLILLAASVFIVMTAAARSQDIVVSEYFNDVSPETGEWTEIVVVKDNLNMVGYILTDNNGQQDARQGGVRFKDIPLWRNVRAGTIIVIYHRGFTLPTQDLDPSDGYLELGAENTTYLDQFLFSGSSWSFNALNIAQEGDYLELFTKDTVHIHGLGHRNPTGPSYDASAPPKVNHDTAAPNSRSVRVSGRTLAAYAAGIGRDSTSLDPLSTKGLPNNVDNVKARKGLPNVNQLLWREWREPTWTATPAVTLVQQTATRHTISWTAVNDPNTKDSTTGVMILRDTLGFGQFDASTVRDGTIINAGTRLSTALVLAVLPNDAGTTYLDSLNILCGETYTYRVYAYRYKPDNRMSVTADTTARGRQYNQGAFAQSQTITKQRPSLPTIAASRTAICPGDTLTLTCTATAERYDWLLNGSIYGSTITGRFVARDPGTWTVMITVEGGCTATSNSVVVTALPAPVVDITPTGTRTICTGEQITLTAETDAAEYEWLRNGNTIPGAASKTYVVTQAGDYQVRIASQQGCPGISAVTRIKVPDVRYRFEPATLDYGSLDACSNGKALLTDIVNTGTETITVTNAAFPPGFSLASPPPGFTVAPGQRQSVRLLFTPSAQGTFSGTATFTAVPCGVQATIALTGNKLVSIAGLDRARVDFGVYHACPTSDIRPDSAILITNNGTTAITVKAPSVNPPFFLLTQFTQKVIQAGQSDTVRIQYRPLGPDLNRGAIEEIKFPYTSTACPDDTLRATLIAAAFLPSLGTTPDTIRLRPLLACDGAYDTTIVVTNDGNSDITLTNFAQNSVTIVDAPIVVKPGTSITVGIRIQHPAVLGAYVINSTLDIQPCSMMRSLTIIGSVIDARASISDATLDMGEVVLCNGNEATAQLRLSIGDGTSTTGIVRQVSLGGPFSTDLVALSTFTGRRDVTVTFRPTSVGTFSDTLTVVVGPCDETVKCVVTGRAVDLSRQTTVTSTSFGILGTGQSTTQRLVIRNTGTAPLPVERLEGIVGPFAVRSSTPALPTTLAPGDSIVVVLEYSFAGFDRKDTITIVSRTTGPCPDSVRYVLTGATTSPGVITGITLELPENMSGRPGSEIDIPMTLRSTVDITGAQITRIVTRMRYDPTILRLLDVRLPSENTATITQISAGTAEIALTFANPVKAGDVVGTVRGRCYLGSSLTTPVDVDTVGISGVIATGRGGLLTIGGDCAIEARQAGIGAPSALIVERVTGDDIVLDVTVLTDDAVTIVMRDLRGAVTSIPLDGRLAPGRYTIRIDASMLASGVHLITMDHGLRHHTATAVIVR